MRFGTVVPLVTTRALGGREFTYELPDGAVQMYLRDPAGNIVGRRLIALTPQGVVSYRTYTNRHGLSLDGFFEKFLDAIEAGAVAVDFDARTGHNHGTKFRLKQNWLPALYAKSVHL